MSANQKTPADGATAPPAAQVKPRRSWHRPVLSVARIRDASSTTTGNNDIGGSLFQS